MQMVFSTVWAWAWPYLCYPILILFRLLKVLYSNYHKLHMKNPVKNIDHLIDGAVYRCSGEVGKIDDFQSTRGWLMVHATHHQNQWLSWLIWPLILLACWKDWKEYFEVKGMTKLSSSNAVKRVSWDNPQIPASTIATQSLQGTLGRLSTCVFCFQDVDAFSRSVVGRVDGARSKSCPRWKEKWATLLRSRGICFTSILVESINYLVKLCLD